MCEACILAASEALDAAGDLRWRRPLTAIEREYGDIPRVDRDFDLAEETVAKAGAALVAKMARQLSEEVAPLVAQGDLAGVGRVTASHVAELAAAFKVAAEKVVRAGRRQILDGAKKAGVKLAVTRKNPKTGAAYIEGRADLASQQIAQQMQTRLQRLATTTIIAEESWGSEELAALEDAGGKALLGIAREVGREAIGVGRLLGIDEVRDQIELVYYSAVMDGKVCGSCASAESEYPDGYTSDLAGRAPNDSCEGGGNCRCVEILVYR